MSRSRYGPYGRRLGRLSALLLSLGLPVAAAFSLLSAIDYTILRQLPYPHADHLYRLRQHHPAYKGDGAYFAPAQIDEIRQSLSSADLVSGIQPGDASVRLGRTNERVKKAVVSRDYLEMVGAAVRSRRSPTDSDREWRGVYLSHRFWLDHLGGERGVLGTELLVDDKAYLVEGVLPPVPLYPAEVDLLLFDEAFPGQKSNRSDYRVTVLLRSRVSEARLRADLQRIAPILGDGIAGPGRAAAGYWLEATPLRQELAGTSPSVLVPLQANSFALLLLGAFNAWCVWYVTALSRHDEIQIRLALGADPKRLMTGFVAECLAMGLIVVGVGMYLGAQTLPLLRGFLASWSARHAEITPSGRAALAIVALSTGLAFIAATAAWHAARRSGGTDLTPRQRGFGLSRRQRRFQRLAIAAQAGVSFILLLAGLSALSKLESLRSMSLGFEPSGVIAAEVELPRPRYAEPEAVLGFTERVRQRLQEALPRRQLAFATSGPLAGDFLYAWILRIEADESGGSEPAVIETRAVSEEYFETLGASFLQGRPFDRHDRLRETSIPVIVNQALVTEYWGSARPPLGRRLFAKGRELTVVGVVRDLTEKNVFPATPPPVLYVPYWIVPHSRLAILVRTGEGAGPEASALRTTILEEEPEAVAVTLTSMTQRHAGLLRPDRLTAHLLSGLAAIGFALFVAGVGSLVFVESASRELEHVVRLVLGSSRSRIAVRLGVSLALTVAGGVLAGTVSFLLLDARGSFISFGPTPGSTLILGAFALTSVAPITAVVAAIKLPYRNLSSVLRRE